MQNPKGNPQFLAETINREWEQECISKSRTTIKLCIKSICLFLIRKLFIFHAWLVCYSKMLFNFEMMIVSIMKLVYKKIMYYYHSIQAAKHVSWPNWMKVEVLLYEVPYVISYAEFSRESISGIINAKSGSVWSIFSISSPAM